MIPSKQIRAAIEVFLQQQRWHQAHLQLGDLWRQEPTAANAGYVLSCYERMRGQLPAVTCRISFLRSMTVEPVIPLLRAAARVAGIDLETQVGQFNSYAQEILDPSSQVYSFDPSIAVLAIQTRDVLPEVWEAYTDLLTEELDLAIDRLLVELSNWIRTFRLRSNASLIVHTFEKPGGSAGILDVQGKHGQMDAVDRLNRELREICRGQRGVYVLDYENLIARHGRSKWHDERKWLTMRMPFANDSFVPLVSEWLKFVHPLTGTTCKVLAVDLDNTLWGGVLGEDAAAGLRVGTEYPGAFYKSLQRVLLDLNRRGVLLAVCSKNNHDEAMSALENLPGMLLRPEHFAAFRINWQDKAQNLREIAGELNVGIDSIAFLDDNPVERQQVRAELPEVKVLELSADPQSYAAVVRDCPLFETLSISTEDGERTRLYRGQQARAELAETASSLEDFYRSLDQEISIAPLVPETIVRVAQLTQKTNQFNVTTRRYSVQEIEEIAGKSDWKVHTVRVKDRFGDNGIVGVLITKIIRDVCEIDTFLLSCRVIGRTIETTILRHLSDASRAGGARFLQGWFVPTEKNMPVRNLYSSHQFERIASRGTATLWRLNLQEAEISRPEWIRLNVGDGTLRAEQASA